MKSLPRCADCGGPCDWVVEWWVSRKCGSEWCQDHDPKYAPPVEEQP